MTRSSPRNQSLIGQSFISSDRETTPLFPSPYVFPSPTLEPDVGGEQACKFVFTLGRIQFLFIFSKAETECSVSTLLPLCMNCCSLFTISRSQVPPFQAWLPGAPTNHPAAAHPPSPLLQLVLGDPVQWGFFCNPHSFSQIPVYNR